MALTDLGVNQKRGRKRRLRADDGLGKKKHQNQGKCMFKWHGRREWAVRVEGEGWERIDSGKESAKGKNQAVTPPSKGSKEKKGGKGKAPRASCILASSFQKKERVVGKSNSTMGAKRSLKSNRCQKSKIDRDRPRTTCEKLKKFRQKGGGAETSGSEGGKSKRQKRRKCEKSKSRGKKENCKKQHPAT